MKKTLGSKRGFALAAVFGLVISSFVVFAGAPVPASAITGSEFQPGRIISDTNFFDANSMNETQIQSFLEAQACSPRDGVPCLQNYSQTTQTIAAVGGGHCAQYAGAANERASRIIAKVAQACGINPKVLLVLLQKEQSLVTRPSSYGYARAMGWGCPDTGPNFSANCDANFFGFFNQTYKSAWQFRQYTQYPVNIPSSGGAVRKYRIGNVFVQYHPNAACGGTNVNIENQATANLYLYTPYQPNASALANLRGTGDSCGAYGNRNFWVMYTDWFGNTQSSTGPGEIEVAYQSMGGPGGLLGQATTGYNEIATNGSGIVKGYAGGAIAWSPSLGAHALYGDIRSAFNAAGGIAGSLGWPGSGVTVVAADSGGDVQSFQGGAITRTNTEGTTVLSGTIRQAFNAAGGLTGPLSWPTGAQTCATSTTCTQPFRNGTLTAQPGADVLITNAAITEEYRAQGGAQGPLGAAAGATSAVLASGGGFVAPLANGAITWNKSSGAHTLTTPFRTALAERGGIAGYLGWPAGNQACNPSQTCSQPFQGGTMVSVPGSGFSVMQTDILSLYQSLNGTNGELGAAIGDSRAVTTANGAGVVQGFANGVVTWTRPTGAVLLTGAIRDAYGLLGGLDGAFGWPTTGAGNVSANGGGQVQGFQHGAITWTSATGAIPLSGDIRAAFGRAGGLDGTLGWPTAAASRVGKGLVQGFQNGAVTSVPGAGAFVISGEIRQLYGTVGGLDGRFGWPVSDMNPVSVAPGGFVQGFENGAITFTDSSGAVYVEGPIRDFYNANGGLTGVLGWPAGAPACPTATSCSQEFQGGFVDWTATTGAVLREDPSVAPQRRSVEPSTQSEPTATPEPTSTVAPEPTVTPQPTASPGSTSSPTPTAVQ